MSFSTKASSWIVWNTRRILSYPSDTREQQHKPGLVHYEHVAMSATQLVPQHAIATSHYCLVRSVRRLYEKFDC